MKSVANRNQVRVIAGKWRRSRIEFPNLPGLRPTSNRVRETAFNWLQDAIVGESCLDLFAGSGACGIEALSRGATSVLFLDKSKHASEAIRNNLRRFSADCEQEKGSDWSVVCLDSLSWLEAQKTGNQSNTLQQLHSDMSQCFGLVFLDPPFDEDICQDACEKLVASGVLKPQALIYLENSVPLSEERLPEGWIIKKTKKAGNVSAQLLQSS